MKDMRDRSEMDEPQLLKILREEEADAASYYTSELAQSQADAMDRYNARPYGDEVENRSKVVTHDIEDTINWIMPSLMRTFASTEDLISCDDDGLPDNDPSLKTAAQYLGHVFFKDNQGDVLIHDFCFDGLLQKVGVLRVYWEDPQPQPPYRMYGVSAEQVQKYASDSQYEILSIEPDGEMPDEPEAERGAGEEAPEALGGSPAPPAPQQQLPPPEMGEGPEQPPMPAQGGLPIASGPPEAALPGLLARPQGMAGQEPQMLQPQMPQQPSGPSLTFSLTLQKTPRIGRARVECFPPENFRISRRAKSVQHADYHGGVFDKFLDDVIRQYPEKARDLDPSGDWSARDTDVDLVSDSRLMARFPDEPDTGRRQSSREAARRKVKMSVEYVNVDFDGDGIVELRRVVRVGNAILENDAVPESEFVPWSPIRVSHRLIGRSLADTLIDIQKIRTVLSRKGMDGLTQALAPRTFVSARAISNDSTILDRMLDHDIGDVIPIDGNPSEAVWTQQTPDVSAAAFQAIQYWDQRSEEASGVNRHSMGISPQAITDTKGGIDSLQAAGNARVEQVARWLGLGLQDCFEKLLRILITHQDRARQIKVKGKSIEVDPRRWSDEMSISVHVGMAAESRERKLMYLGSIAAKQEQILKEAGPSNPIVGLHEYRQTLVRMAETMGEKNPSMFFKEIDPNWKPPPPGPDPKMAEVQGKQQLAQADMQGKQQLAQAQHQLETQKAQATMQMAVQSSQYEAQIKAQRASEDAKIAQQIAMVKANADKEIASLKIQGEQQLSVMKLAQEKELAMIRLEQEREMGMMRMAQEKEMAMHAAKAKVDVGSSGEGGGFRPGGRLDA